MNSPHTQPIPVTVAATSSVPITRPVSVAGPNLRSIPVTVTGKNHPSGPVTGIKTSAVPVTVTVTGILARLADEYWWVWERRRSRENI